MCFKCRTAVDKLEMFPGHLCKECYKNLVEHAIANNLIERPSAEEMVAMFTNALTEDHKRVQSERIKYAKEMSK